MTSSTKIAEKKPREATQVNYSQDDAKQGGLSKGMLGKNSFYVLIRAWIFCTSNRRATTLFYLKIVKSTSECEKGSFLNLVTLIRKSLGAETVSCMLALSHLLFRTANTSSSIWNWLTLHFLAAKHEMWGGEILENHVKMCWAAILKQWQRLIL